MVASEVIRSALCRVIRILQPPQKKRYLEIILSGGLGNQLFQLSAGIAAMEALDCELHLLKVKTAPGDTERDTEVGFATGISGVRLVPNSFRLCKKGEGTADNGSFLELELPATLTGYFQNQRFPKVAYKKLVEALGSNREFSAGQEALRDPVRPVIAVHLRRGDYLQQKNIAYHGLLSFQYFSDGISRLAPALVNPRILIFTDTEPEGRKLAQTLPYDVEVFPPSSSLFALGALSAADGWVLSNSTFGWWGAYIGWTKKGGQVVAPTKWFTRPKTQPIDLIPKDWITIPDPEW